MADALTTATFEGLAAAEAEWFAKVYKQAPGNI
jgi:hypothetical protein